LLQRRELEDLTRFVADRGQESLFSWLDVDQAASQADIEAAISQKRGWAQGQQSNPKFRTEALWVIKNSSLLRKTLLKNRDHYVADLQKRQEARHRQTLALFIQGSLATGILTETAEAAIREQGRGLGLTDAAVSEEITAWLRKTGARRGEAHTPKEPDWYGFLEVAADAHTDEIEQAYRLKYRWARQLKDTARADEMYSKLDEAWRVLKHPLRRTEYDARLNPSEAAATSPVEDPVPEFGLHSGSSELAFSEEPPVGGRLRIQGAPEPASAGGGRSSHQSPDMSERKRRSAPQPPDAIAKRAMALDDAKRPRRKQKSGPHLVVDGDINRLVEVGAKPRQIRITVRNTGDGPMPGQVLADRDWVTVSPDRLQSGRRSQEITVTIDPQRMPRRQAVCLVSISASRGQRASITLNVKRPDRRPLALALAAALLLGLGVSAWYAFSGQDVAPVEPGRLLIKVDPPAGEIWLGDELMAAEGILDLVPEGSPDEPLHVRVSLDGFAEWSKTVTVPPGQTLRLAPILRLTDTMSMPHLGSQTEGKVDEDRARAVLNKRQARLAECLVTHATSQEPGTPLELTMRVRLGSTGSAVGFQAVSREGVSSNVDTCLKREVRSLRYPLVPGDYGEFTYELRGVMPPQGDPSG